MKTTRPLLVVTIMAVLILNLGLSGCRQEPAERTSAELQIDQELGEAVKNAFGYSPAFKFPDVQVASFKGRVQLSGFVQSEAQKRSAETIAKGVRGVVEVENNISLKQ